MALWCKWSTHLPVTQESAGSNPVKVVKNKIYLKDFGGVDSTSPITIFKNEKKKEMLNSK